MYDQIGLYKRTEDPQELYNFIRYLRGPGKTLWTIDYKNLALPYRTKENNTIIQ